MSAIQIFNNSDFGNIRITQENGKVMFCGKDVATVLGYSRPHKAISDHCKGGTVLETPTNGGVQPIKFITEGDVYRLIVHSRLPKAEKFERWVFDEVLPSIRQTGGYGDVNLQTLITETVRLTTTEVIKQIMPLFQQNTSTAHADDSSAVEEIVIKKRTRRKPAGIIEKLDPELRKVVDDMICSPRCTYQDIKNMLNECEIEISLGSINRYAKRYF